jgi:hypothetical protein
MRPVRETFTPEPLRQSGTRLSNINLEHHRLFDWGKFKKNSLKKCDARYHTGDSDSSNAITSIATFYQNFSFLIWRSKISALDTTKVARPVPCPFS